MERPRGIGAESQEGQLDLGIVRKVEAVHEQEALVVGAQFLEQGVSRGYERVLAAGIRLVEQRGRQPEGRVHVHPEAQRVVVLGVHREPCHRAGPLPFQVPSVLERCAGLAVAGRRDHAEELLMKDAAEQRRQPGARTAIVRQHRTGQLRQHQARMPRIFARSIHYAPCGKSPTRPCIPCSAILERPVGNFNHKRSG